MPNYNFPDKNDPDFADKVVDLIEQLFSTAESPIKNFDPIEAPQEGVRVGSIYYDSSDNKVKVVTPNGVKIIQFE